MFVRRMAANLRRKTGTYFNKFLEVRFATFSASSLAFISECGTERMRRVKSTNVGLDSKILGIAFGFASLESPLMPPKTSA
jgi:hypothetical protein